MNSLCVNVLLEWQSDEVPRRVDRILWIDPSGADAVMIQLETRALRELEEIHQKKPSVGETLPKWHKVADLEAALLASELRILEQDPYAALLLPEESISPEHRKRRNAAWELIKPLVERGGENLFIPNMRGRLLTAICKETGKTKRLIYGYLRRYWQGGQTKNALLPLFHKCGGKSKERQVGEKKRGRPSALARAQKMCIGINVTPDIATRFQRGLNSFHEQYPGKPFTQAFQFTLENYFNAGYDLQDGALVPKLPPAEELPTFRQFRYWYEKQRDPTRALIAREGRRRFNTRHRALLGDSTQMAFGPGKVFQIDATIGDIYLVSSLDPTRIIGRPVIYDIQDVFSRMIVGISVTLEGPSWLGAMLTLENAHADKVAFCQEYGVTITEEQWPCHHLSEAYLADRGEFEGYNADNLTNSLNIRVDNTAPWRADWKGIIERNFRLSNEKMIHFLPGAVYRPRERGDHDYRLDACLTLRQFRKLMIYCALHHNNEHRMDWYRLDEFMIGDHIEPYPIDLWNWGIQNRGGTLRRLDHNIVLQNLLPQEEASVTERGIIFRGLPYTCELALKEQWFIRARERGRWQIPVAFDPRLPEIIYLRLEDGRKLEPCSLLEQERRFAGRDWEEIQDYFELQKQGKEASRTREQQGQAKFHALVDAIVKEAQETKQEVPSTQSKRARLRGIRANRAEERLLERTKGAWQLAAEQPDTSSKETGDLTQREPALEKGPAYVPPPKLISKLRQLHEERLNHEQ